MNKSLSRLCHSIAYRIPVRRPKIDGLSDALKQRFIEINENRLELISDSLKEHYFPKQVQDLYGQDAEKFLATEVGQTACRDHVTGRLEVFRKYHIPWLNHARPLLNANILEVGCGTGASTVALAEQGAHVTAIDVDHASVVVAQERCKQYGVQANFEVANATRICELAGDGKFDFVIFFAVLEHMTFEERIQSLEQAWSILSDNGLLCVVESPNRLWHFDDHTSQMPFFMWLPDDVAFHYSKYSPRDWFNTAYRRASDESKLSFIRQGRGVSYHDVEIAIGDAAADPVSYLADFQSQSNSVRLSDFGKRFSLDNRYRKMLKEMRPGTHDAYLQPYLDLILKKKS